MDQKHYQDIIKKADLGYAYHKIILNKNKRPVDYIVIEVNSAYEKITGIKKKDVEGKKITDIIPDIFKKNKSWLKITGDISLNGGKKGYIHYFDVFNKWIKAKVYSDRKFYFTSLFSDISEFKKNEKDLNAAKERFELAVKGSNDGIWDWNIETNDLFLSDRWKQQLGYKPKELKNKFSTFANLVHKDDKDRVFSFINKYLEGKIKKYDIEFRMYHKKNKIVWIRARGEAFYNEDKKPYRMAGSHTDITNKIEAQKIIKEREEQFRIIFNNSPQPMVLSEVKTGKIKEINNAFCQRIEYKRKQIIGKTSTELGFYQKKDRKIFTDLLIKNGKVNGLEMDLVTFKKNVITAKMFATFISINSKQYILTIFDDITNQKKIENSLKQSEKKYRYLVENVNDIIYQLSPDGYFTYVSSSWKYMLGHDINDVLGKHFSKYVHPEDIEICKNFLSKIINTGKKQSGVEYRVKHKNKSWRWHTSNASPLIDSLGSTISYIGIARDFTERKKREEEIERSRIEAEKANKAKSEFLANMSHEIRTPLNAVIGFTELLNNTKLTPIQKEYIDNANVSAQTLLDIVNDVLDLSKIEANKLELDITKSDIVELLEQTIDIIKFPASKKGLELLLDIPPDLPRYAMIDRIRLRQIIVNLLGNALKFTSKGEIELKVLFDINKKNKRVKYSFFIRDTGVGISKKAHKKLFKAFSQADSSTTRNFGGTGLGLIISNLLAQKMGTSINFKSKKGKGATFYFTLETEYKQNTQSKIKFESIKRALVIDDNKNNRTILEHMLNSWNISFVGCKSGALSLKVIKDSRPFDIIIVDYHMPNMNGIETIKKIRKIYSKEKKDQPVILLHSSVDDYVVQQECNKLGVEFKLVKPVKSNDLLYYLKNINKKSQNEFNEKKHVVKPFSSKQKQIANQNKNSKVLKILIAEDNIVNMMLTEKLIKLSFPYFDIIKSVDGKKTIKDYKRFRPDIILMDIQMPKMDGIDAARYIRKYEKDYKKKKTVIVALTAGTTKFEKEKCLKAGMNDFLSKPINNYTLSNIIKKYFNINKFNEK